MKHVFTAICILYALHGIAGPCSLPRVKINYYGPYSSDQFQAFGSVYFPMYTDYTLHIHGSLPCNNTIKKVRLYRESVLLLTIDTACYYLPILLKSVPGNYKIIADFDTWKFYPNYCEWTYKVFENPTGVNEVTSNSEYITIQPNPATNNLFVVSEQKELRKVTLFDSMGAMLATFDCNSQILEIPLQNYPPGIYYLQVATVNERPSIKKL